ncbi:MAG: glycosyltransferase family 4 protein [Verrucomicrobiota bacterium]
MSRPRPKVLLVAEAANPELTSVALIGHSFSQALQEVAEVHLVTELRNEESLRKAGVPWEFFTTVDNRKAQGLAFDLAKRLRGGNNVGWTTYSALSNLAYPFFEKGLWKQFGPRLKQNEFDVVHRITPLSPTSSSWLAPRLAKYGIPYVIGPLNGGVPWPEGFGDVRRKEKEWLSYVRPLYKLAPGIRSTRHKADALVLASQHTYGEVACCPKLESKAVYLPENAIDPERFPGMRFRPYPQPKDQPIRAAFVGRLVPYKGADMLIEAAAPFIREGGLVLDIIGDGEQMPELKALVEKLALEGRVELPGWIEHSQLHSRLSLSQVFAFPSVREFGGGVVLEAMALGLAPIVMDYGGPAELVPEECGSRVEMGSREEIIERFREVLGDWLQDRDEIARRGARAQSFVKARFTWPAKARQMREVYDWVLGEREEKPDWGRPFNFVSPGH